MSVVEIECVGGLANANEVRRYINRYYDTREQTGDQARAIVAAQLYLYLDEITEMAGVNVYYPLEVSSGEPNPLFLQVHNQIRNSFGLLTLISRGEVVADEVTESVIERARVPSIDPSGVGELCERYPIGGLACERLVTAKDGFDTGFGCKYIPRAGIYYLPSHLAQSALVGGIDTPAARQT